MSSIRIKMSKKLVIHEHLSILWQVFAGRFAWNLDYSRLQAVHLETGFEDIACEASWHYHSQSAASITLIRLAHSSAYKYMCLTSCAGLTCLSNVAIDIFGHDQVPIWRWNFEEVMKKDEDLELFPCPCQWHWLVRLEIAHACPICFCSGMNGMKTNCY